MLGAAVGEVTLGLWSVIVQVEGYYLLMKTGQEIVFNDLKFSTVKGWFDLQAHYVFSFQIFMKKRPILIERKAPAVEITTENFQLLWERVINP